jgi:hypothetical protein
MFAHKENMSAADSFMGHVLADAPQPQGASALCSVAARVSHTNTCMLGVPCLLTTSVLLLLVVLLMPGGSSSRRRAGPAPPYACWGGCPGQPLLLLLHQQRGLPAV